MTLTHVSAAYLLAMLILAPLSLSSRTLSVASDNEGMPGWYVFHDQPLGFIPLHSPIVEFAQDDCSRLAPQDLLLEYVSSCKSSAGAKLAGQREGLGFTQPVAGERLTPVEILPLSKEDEGASTRPRISLAGRERDGTITVQALDGKVYFKFDDNPDSDPGCLAVAKLVLTLA